MRQVIIDSNCIICMKVNKNFAIKLVAEETVTDIEARVVSCDGGGGALGHPKVYINLVRVNPLPLPLHYILVLINPVFLIGGGMFNVVSVVVTRNTIIFINLSVLWF